MLCDARLKIDTCAPCLVEGVDSGADHARERLEAVEFSEGRLQQYCLNGASESFVIDGPGQTAGQPSRELLEGHYLEPVSTFASRREPQFAHR
jgi:hypothetical protein